MEKYLKDTYGITVYQEQVMLQSRALGGFTRGMSDSLRKAMGKKKIAEMDKLKVKFIEGCLANEAFIEGFEKEVKGKGKTFKVKLADDKEVTRKIEKAEDLIDKIWLDWEAFAQYAFNKSHSVCYAYIAYQTGYLKAHHPAEFMAAVLSRNLSDIEKVTIFMDECKRMRLPVLGPDVNESYLRFTVNKEGAVRFGMAAVKGVGEAAVEDIINERKKGDFKDIFDFVERVNLRTVNKRTLENLAMSGGFDSFELNRSQYFACDEFETPFIELLSKYGNKLQTEKAMAQQTLFGGVEDYVVTPPKVPSSGEWNKLERLNKEKALIGIYLSAHPLDDYRLAINKFCKASLAQISSDLEQFKDNDINIAGMVTSVRRGITRTGNPFAIVNIEDFTDSYELPFFGKDFVEFNNFFIEGLSLFICGRVQQRTWPKDSTELEYKIRSIELLDGVLEQRVKRITLTIPVKSLTQELVNEIEFCLMDDDNKGGLLVNFVIVDEGKMKLKMFSRTCKVKLSTELIEYFENNSEIDLDFN